MPDAPHPPSLHAALHRFREAFEAQLETLAEELRRSVAAERDDVSRESQRTAEIERAQAVEAAVQRARAEAEQALALSKTEAEQKLNHARGDAEQALAEARAQAEQTLARTRAEAEQTLATQVATARSEGVARAEEELAALTARLQRQLAESAAAPAINDVLQGMRRLDAAASLSQVFDALVEVDLPKIRIAMFVANGPTLRGWRGVGFDGPEGVDVRYITLVTSTAAGLLAQAVTTGDTCYTRGEPGEPEPEFIPLPRGRRAVAVPVRVGGRAVGALYADNARDSADAPGESDDATRGAPSWANSVEILARYAGRCLEALTAARTSQVLQAQQAGAAGGAAAPGERSADTADAARRYARLLVSEIKLYNEAAVRAGRENRDLLTRLAPEIERARRLYDERVPLDPATRRDVFDQEIVRTLADGDASVLG
jgi:hypothetical protein